MNSMDWLRENWFWLIVGIAFLWVHMKMHGGHRHGGNGPRRHDGTPLRGENDSTTPSEDETHGQH